MKKLFSAFTAVLLAFCFISCAPQELSDSSSKNNGSVSLSIDKSTRTISPAEGISYTNVQTWTVTFRDTDKSHSPKYDDIIVKDVNFNVSPSKEIRLPIGTYKIIFEGNAQGIPFYGEDSVTVEKNQTVSKSVLVAPKKSDKGTGSFNFTVTTSGFGNNPPNASTGNSFTVSLTPYGGTNPTATWTPSITTSENGDIYSFSVSSDTLESKSVPSGFYTLSIKYTWFVGEDSVGQLLTKTKEIYSPYHDFFVEIIDGLTTNGSADIKVSLEESKTYYATTGKTMGNGAFKSMPKNLDELLEDIDGTTISTANIIIVDSLAADGKIIYPEIDVSKVNATGVCYEISVLTSEGKVTHCYSIKDEDGDGNPIIDTEVNIIKLKDSSAAGKAVDVYNNSDIKLQELQLSLKNNTSVAIKFEVHGPVILDKIDSFDYYSTHPFMTADVVIDNLILSSTLAESYTTASKTISENEYEYYILPAVKEEPTINGFAYDLVATKNDLSVKDTPLYAGDTVTITATSESEGGSFADGTTFAWFINGEKIDCTAQSYEITFGVNAEASNTIICLVGYNGEYSTKSIDLNAQENTVVLYNNTSDTTKPALSYATLTDSSVLSPKELLAKETSTKIVDYCFDNSNNLYAIVRNIGTTATIYSINKYTYNNGDNTSTTYTIGVNENVSAIDYIEASNDGKLYAVITRSTESTTSTSIAELDLTSSNDTVGFTGEYALPTNWPSGDNTYYYIQTFCTDGTNFYFILLKTSPETSSYNLVSCTVSNSQLTETTSILLASTVESDTSPVFSNYGDALEYKDLCCINNKLYLLVRDVVTEGYNNTSYSRGALCTFTVGDNGKITAGKMDTGYQKTSRSFSYTGSYDQATVSYPTITRTAYIGDVDSKLFYGPVKFVARKQDELIIADDGFSIKVEDYTDQQGHTQATVSSKNAVVTYNLKTESLNFVSLDGEYFEEKYSGYFYSSGFFNQ